MIYFIIFNIVPVMFVTGFIIFGIPTIYLFLYKDEKDYFKTLCRLTNKSLLISIFVIFTSYCSIQNYSDRQETKKHQQYILIEKNKVIQQRLLNDVKSEQIKINELNDNLNKKINTASGAYNKCSLRVFYTSSSDFLKCLEDSGFNDIEGLKKEVSNVQAKTENFIKSQNVELLYKYLDYSNEYKIILNNYLLEILGINSRVYYNDKFETDEIYSDKYKTYSKGRDYIMVNQKYLDKIYTEALDKYLDNIEKITKT